MESAVGLATSRTLSSAVHGCPEAENKRERGGGGGDGGCAPPARSIVEQRRNRQPTTAPSLKIGRYMPTTMPPTTVPMTTMIIGSSRLDSASTALLTSVS